MAWLDNLKDETKGLWKTQFDISSLVYPLDLLNSDRYAGSYTAFFISVHQDSQLAGVDTLNESGTRYLEAKGSQIQESIRNNPNQKGAFESVSKHIGALASGFGAKTFAETAVGTLTGGIVAQAGQKLVGAGVGIAVGMGVEASEIGKVKTEFKQQKAVIILPTPNITTNYNLNWSETDLALAGGMGELGGELANLANFTKESHLSQAVVNASEAIALSVPQMGGFASRLGGISANPRKEQIFKDVAFRNFSFTYTFAPRSKKEAEEVKKIIKMFKFHAHPELKSGNFVYLYPSEFDIAHYFDGEINENLPKHTTSVLESVSVNYAPQGHYNVQSDGQPSQIQMTLNFKELGILTKESIEEGY